MTGSCFTAFSCCGKHDQKELGEENGFISSYMSSPSLEEAKAGTPCRNPK